MALAEASVPRRQVATYAVERPERRVGRMASRLFFLVLLAGVTVVFLAPLAWLVSASLKTRSQVFNGEWVPDPVMWSNYVDVWRAAPVLSWLQNSLVVGLLGAVAVTLSSAAVAFGFAYFRFRGRDVLFGLVLATMMLPGAVTMIPVYLIWNELGLVNTLVPLWAGNLFGSAFYVFLLRQFYLGLPRDLFDAARIDGVSEPGLFFRIGLPLVGPGLAALGIFSFIGNWNAYLWPLIAGQSPSMRTVPVGISLFSGEAGAAWHLIMAASSLAIIPVLLVFVLLQRQIIEGVVLTGLKG